MKIITLVKILIPIIFAGLYTVCFRMNFPEPNARYSKVNLIFFFIFFVSLLTMSFLYGKSKKYIAIMTTFFSIVIVTFALGIVFSSIEALWPFYLVIPATALLVPFSALNDIVPSLFNHSAAVMSIIPITYVLIFAAHRLGKLVLKRRGSV